MIVSIGLDHMERLGSTEEAIALQKAGIIKPGGLVVSGVTQPECQAVIKTCLLYTSAFSLSGATTHSRIKPVTASGHWAKSAAAGR